MAETWMPIRLMRRGQAPSFGLKNQPQNNYVTPAQQWFLDQILDLEPGSHDTDSGGYAHKKGYHDTVEHNDARSGVGMDYSARDPQDRRGPHDKTRGRDWGFTEAWSGDYSRFEIYGDRLLAAYERNDPRLKGWREYLGRVSKAIDINGVMTRLVGLDFRHRYKRIPDGSHNTHGHYSESTEFVESFENKWAILTVLAGWTVEEWQESIGEGLDMGTLETILAGVNRIDRRLPGYHLQDQGETGTDENGRPKGQRSDGTIFGWFQLREALAEAKLRDEAILAKLDGKDATEAVNQAAAELKEQAERHVAELTTQIQAVDEEVLRRLGDITDPAETARILRAALGDRADAVFRAGLGE